MKLSTTAAIVSILLSSGAVSGWNNHNWASPNEEARISPMTPYGVVDDTKPRQVLKSYGDGTTDVFQTHPGTWDRDYRKPTYRIER